MSKPAIRIAWLLIAVFLLVVWGCFGWAFIELFDVDFSEFEWSKVK